MPETTTLAAVGQEDAPAAGNAPAASAPTPDPAEVKRQNDERARQGRLLAEARRQAEEAKTEVAQLRDTVGELLSESDARKRLEHEAYLNSLPETERLRVEMQDSKEEIDRLRAKVDAPAAPPASAQRQYTDDEKVEIRRTRKAAIIAQVNTEHGLTGEFAIDPDDEFLNDANPDTFFGSATTLARTLAQAKKRASNGNGQEDPMAKKTETEALPQTAAEMNALIDKAVSERMGAGAPYTAEARGGANRPAVGPTSEQMQDATRGYDSKLGPKANLRKLEEMRTNAQKALIGK
jgi:hypothetical protein